MGILDAKSRSLVGTLNSLSHVVTSVLTEIDKCAHSIFNRLTNSVLVCRYLELHHDNPTQLGAVARPPRAL